MMPPSSSPDKPSLRTGLGFDLHRLVPDGPPLMIGGIEIPSDRGPVAHSDGDVLLHAIADAGLGATGMGDIGTYFPDDDPAYEDLSGRVVIGEISKKLASFGFRVCQIDTVLLLEKPAISSHRSQIQKNIGQMFELDRSRVGVKATTMEGLGPIGQEDAFAAWATVLLDRKDA